MSQLFMRLLGAHGSVEIPPHRIVDSASPEYSPEALADGWIACCEALNGGLWTRERFERDMRGDPKIREDGILFAAAPDGALIATASVQFGRACAYVPDLDYAASTTLHMVGTRGGYASLGAGLAVCVAAADYSLAHGIQTMYLTTDDFRVPAIKIYLKLGFRPVLYDEDQVARWRAVAAVLAREIPCVAPDGREVALKGDSA